MASAIAYLRLRLACEGAARRFPSGLMPAARLRCFRGHALANDAPGDEQRPACRHVRSVAAATGGVHGELCSSAVLLSVISWAPDSLEGRMNHLQAGLSALSVVSVASAIRGAAGLEARLASLHDQVADGETEVIAVVLRRSGAGRSMEAVFPDD